MASKDVVCYLWNEVEDGLNASEFASCLVSYLEDNAESFDKAVIYSDGCTFQNQNRVLATALRYFCVKYGKTIEQKILERGHTQMEVDSVHAIIERRLKNMDVYSPLDYVNLVKVARSNPYPYKVKYLTFDFFKDFDMYKEGTIKSIKPSKRENVTSICALRYSEDGSLCYKLNFSDDWEILPLGRRNQIPTADPHRLYKCKRKIKKSKFDHLQFLKAVLPAEVQHF
ncbi:hypothetical protein PoB_003054500 [Plakobranchus ocellatus]|uniref:Integrase catalytic domain-containing protein n=1 Tax=Plakobranchus ocellatus TaxID=259542 RepID=A0AAV4A9J7_9GAST|nr:hypothetical protein PoB_003054500 [Plakobranchus ocellatus]